MSDFRLIAARRLRWDKNASQRPAFIALTISALKNLLQEEAPSAQDRAEAEMLIKQLYLASKTGKSA